MGENSSHEKKGFVQYANGPSLDEINGKISVPKNMGFWKTLFAYSGPGALVAVGYMDPGNWATSITGGQNFGYLLMSVILISSLIAMLLQYMAAKLGIVSQMDLAQAIRARTSKTLGIVLWIMTEFAIMATDIAEVIGGAIALYLLFNIPLIFAVFLTVFDVLILLLLTKIGFRKIEAIVVCLIVVILLVFVYQVVLSHPDWAGALKGLLPVPETISTGHEVAGMTPLSGALGIIGATVMPHNLYLHSAISQTRKIDHNDEEDVARTIRFTTWDSNVQLTFAFFVNALLLIMGVAVFKSGAVQDTSFFGLFDALNNTKMLSNPILISVAKSGILSTLFAVALLASGQNSTITGTLTGQVIMEGFINLKVPLWARRLITRLISVIPVLICVSMTAGESTLKQHAAINDLIENSQIFLAFALPFSMLPLLMMTNSKFEMGKKFANTMWVKVCGWISVLTLTFLNLYNMKDSISGFYGDNPTAAQDQQAGIIAWIVNILIVLLLIWTLTELHRGNKRFINAHPELKD
ncbi:Nramp family divalent metal transporter [Apilactobacillus micheneri]|uniref:Divalent metal cation transporter MntH n=1 Tax=Apilactobacillus micheneri TaxID=1899430 RepID=A0A9Q8IMH6_9LACO|nr:Nramp family divalent metal transporter [Apilactobacillus micheneri]TPR40096.1 divalent metal cation transporter [Apilactobacillus micheneri]TPR41907.1 divalent metal cation transporter [Apilactobacillus micheneri]TPR44298.1 divalent metal cation transporter [Apilactobacillus micheneri]TPR45922.1 divalent metal cation transporter [Apilactobacillus micheneri]TPR51682.1 divalent metal cation transporter [Apilactobacillus micheneri]